MLPELLVIVTGPDTRVTLMSPKLSLSLTVPVRSVALMLPELLDNVTSPRSPEVSSWPNESSRSVETPAGPVTLNEASQVPTGARHQLDRVSPVADSWRRK